MSFQHRRLPYDLKTIEINGYEMAYVECGQGAPVLLVHGSLNDYRAWELQMEPLGAGYRTISVSLRHAYPERWNGEGDKFSVRQHADDLAVFIEKLEIRPVHLIAHSRGGDVALILAAQYPKLVESMVLADPAPFKDMLPKTPDVIAEAENRNAFVTAAIERLRRGDVDGGLEIFTDAVSAAGSWQKLPESAKQIRRDNVWSLLSLITDAQEDWDCTDAMMIDAPTLLLTGDKSPRLYAMMHAALLPCLKRQQKVTIPNASHRMHSDNPKKFNATVLKFLMEYKPHCCKSRRAPKSRRQV